MITSITILVYSTCPFEQVSYCNDRVFSCKQIGLRSVYLELLHDLNHECSPRGWHCAFLDQDFLKFLSWDIKYANQDKSILECLRKLLAPAITFCWVLCSENAESWMGLNHSLGLNDMQLSIVVK